MKKFLVELDDAAARDLERVAPAAKRLRAEFVRLAIRRALDLALDRRTREAYEALPMRGADETGDALGWDPENLLARPPGPRRRRRRAA